jgi:hypothetical protein
LESNACHFGLDLVPRDDFPITFEGIIFLNLDKSKFFKELKELLLTFDGTPVDLDHVILARFTEFNKFFLLITTNVVTGLSPPTEFVSSSSGLQFWLLKKRWVQK